MGVAAFVAGVDRVLTRGHGLFPAGGGFDSGGVFAAGGGPGPAPVVPPPGGDSGVAAAGGVYQQARSGVGGLDGDAGQAVAEGGGVGVQGRSATGLIRDQARAVGAASAALGRSPAGARLVMASMDQHLSAMQAQLDQATAENRLLAQRIRALAVGYRGLASSGGVGMPSGLGGFTPGGGSGGVGGLGGVSGLSSVAGSLMRGLGTAGSGAGGDLAGRAAGGHAGISLTQDSSAREVAEAIICEAKRRGYSSSQTIAILSTAMQESGLRPRAVSPNGLWRSIFQQDSSYPGRSNPNTAISGFFDRLAHHGGPSSADIWKSIFWLQQRPGELSAEAAVAHGRRGYLNEIQSQLPKAAALYNSIVGMW